MNILRERLANKTVELYNAKDRGEIPQSGNAMVIGTPIGSISKRYKVSSGRKMTKVQLVRSDWLRSSAIKQVEDALKEISQLENNLETYYFSEIIGQSTKRKAIALQRKIVKAFEAFRVSNVITYLEISNIENNRLNIKVSIPKVMDTYENEFNLYSLVSRLENSENIIIHLDVHIDKNRA